MDAEHLVGPGDPVLRDQPLPAPDAGHTLGLGQLALPLAEPPLGLLPLGHLAQELFVGGRQLGGAVANPTLQFDVPLAFFEKVDLPKSLGGLVTQKLYFTAQSDPTRGFPAEALLINTATSAY